ncbi:hypothetical protein BH09MYX1_BH09MYX1_57110 [soil metagenome]
MMKHLLPFAVVLFACSSAPATPTPDAGPQYAAPYTHSLLDSARITSDSSKPNFQKVTADVELEGTSFADVKLVVDLSSTCFPFDNWTTNAPPPGQNWPADCDAFDRNFEMSLLDPANASAPGLELIRAITPFGGPLHLEADVTDAFNVIKTKKRTFQVVIPTYGDGAGKVSGSNGGWNVSAHLDVTPGDMPRNVLAVIPLWYSDVKDGAVENKAPFTLPKGTTRTLIEYRVTGHGGADGTSTGCSQPADEFCSRSHAVAVDGTTLETFKPWRADCKNLCTLTPGGPFGGDYCKENPCGSPASVRASRANWCPGSMTPPKSWEPALAEGAHDLTFTIDKISGQWRVSATAYAYGD